jgi:DNA-binding CsgD family transcriptional regulator
MVEVLRVRVSQKRLSHLTLDKGTTICGLEVPSDAVYPKYALDQFVCAQCRRLQKRHVLEMYPTTDLIIRRRKEGATFASIASELGVSRQRVHQLERRLRAVGLTVKPSRKKAKAQRRRRKPQPPPPPKRRRLSRKQQAVAAREELYPILAALGFTRISQRFIQCTLGYCSDHLSLLSAQQRTVLDARAAGASYAQIARDLTQGCDRVTVDALLGLHMLWNEASITHGLAAQSRAAANDG